MEQDPLIPKCAKAPLLKFFNETVVYHVLKYLDPEDLHAVSQTSSFIRKVVLAHINSGAWILSFQNKRYEITDEAVAKLAESFSSVRHADLNGCIKLTDEALIRFADHCKGIEMLQIDGTVGFPIRHIGDPGGVAISKFHSLKELKLRRSMITSAGIEAIFSNSSICSSLRTLDLAGNTHMGDSALAAVAKCKSLESLNLSGCARLSADGLIVFFRGAMGTFLPQLRHLHLAKVQTVSNRVLQGLREAVDTVGSPLAEGSKEQEPSIAGRTLALHTLDVRGCRRVGDAGIGAVLPKCPKLVSLSVRGCLGIASVWNQPVVQACVGNLTSLDISSVRFDPLSLFGFFKSTPMLSTLTMHETSVPSSLMDALATSVSKQLKCFDIGRLSHTLEEPSEQALIRFAQETGNLESLIVDGVSTVSIAFLQAILNTNSKLHRLDIRSTAACASSDVLRGLLYGLASPSITELGIDCGILSYGKLQQLFPKAVLLIEQLTEEMRPPTSRMCHYMHTVHLIPADA